MVVGDIIRVKSTNQQGKIVNTINGNYLVRYRVLLFYVFSKSGNNVISWMSKDDIEKDIKYYRDLKIEMIINGDKI